eukprot:TRINITY_DN3075_c0_g1_i1.p1 TRINITY_DN3075_c0_g1~~TRINITY_DN3075_c0_g1_i1.p1  ORF type:complete len:393 (+),score=89.93 TRINITY_DN3075_c0_g1_i1:32-1210(+)
MRKLLILSAGIGAVYYATRDPDSTFYNKLVMPMLRKTDPELSHKIGIFASKLGLGPVSKYVDDPILHQTIFNRKFTNPIGLAAGYDKNAEAMDAMFKIGFSFVEVGTVVPNPQEGNPLPRVFRLSQDGAVINRYGFNSQGMDAVINHLKSYYKDQRKPEHIVGINLGKNKLTEHATSDYVKGIESLSEYADYLVINVSSPNTPNLRDLQQEEKLRELVSGVKSSLDQKYSSTSTSSRPPLFVKISPDINYEERESIAKVAIDLDIDGIIVSNTTIQRSFPNNERTSKTLTCESEAKETGGLSGKPLFELSNAVLKDMYKLTGGKLLLIGVGGVFTGEDALTKIKNGASLVQIYSSMALEGPGQVERIKKQLVEELKKEGYTNVSQAIGKSIK